MTNSGYQSNNVRYTTPSRLQQLQGQVDEVTIDKIQARIILYLILLLH